MHNKKQEVINIISKINESSFNYADNLYNFALSKSCGEAYRFINDLSEDQVISLDLNSIKATDYDAISLNFFSTTPKYCEVRVEFQEFKATYKTNINDDVTGFEIITYPEKFHKELYKNIHILTESEKEKLNIKWEVLKFLMELNNRCFYLNDKIDYSSFSKDGKINSVLLHKIVGNALSFIRSLEHVQLKYIQLQSLEYTVYDSIFMEFSICNLGKTLYVKIEFKSTGSTYTTNFHYKQGENVKADVDTTVRMYIDALEEIQKKINEK